MLSSIALETTHASCCSLGGLHTVHGYGFVCGPQYYSESQREKIECLWGKKLTWVAYIILLYYYYLNIEMSVTHFKTADCGHFYITKNGRRRFKATHNRATLAVRTAPPECALRARRVRHALIGSFTA